MNPLFLLFFQVFILIGGDFGEEKKSAKIALIVALSEYADHTGWSNLNANNDIPLVRHALLAQGFKDSDIKVLENSRATKAGIIEAMEKHLIQKAKRGGIAFFHFTGHGQQVQDTNADELDGLDEALVPYDSPLNFQKGIYEGENLLRDDELGALIQRLRRKLGKKGQVLVVLDACHSGTGTRGLSIARGTDIVMADSIYLNNLNESRSDGNSLNSETHSSKRGLASMVSFFGSAANQLNYETVSSEGQPVGSLSYAFSQAFIEAKKESSYRALFEKIQLKMAFLAPNQTPQSEGNLDSPLLGGQLLGKVQYFRVAKNGRESETRLRLDGGTLSGLFPGTILQFFPPDTRDPAKTTPMASGKVIQATPFSAVVELNSTITERLAVDSWVFVHQQQFGDLLVQVKLDLSQKHLEKKVLEHFSEYPVIKQVKDKPELIIQSFGGFTGLDSLRLLTTHGKVLYQSSIEENHSSTAWHLVQSILAYVQSNFLRSFDMRNDQMDVHMDILPTADKGESLRQSVFSQFDEGEMFRIRISNKGTLPVYFTVIDIQPDNEINIIIPAPRSGHTSRELFLQPGDEMVYPNTFTIAPPYGTEVLKLIATHSPINLSPIVSERGKGMSENVHPFEKLFSATYLNDKRGQTQLSIGTMIHVNSKVFEIKKKE